MKAWIKGILVTSLALGLLALGMFIQFVRPIVSMTAESESPPQVDAEREDRELFVEPRFSNTHAVAASGAGSGGEQTLADIASRARSSVVSIAATHIPKKSANSSPRLPFDLPDQWGEQGFSIPGFPELPGLQQRNRPRHGLGSGVVVSQGVILTNNHVVENASEITVIDADDRRHQAELVGADPPTDLAVLKLEEPATTLTPIQFGDSNEVRPGDIVLAVGNPFGVGQTVTMGIVSAKGRSSMGIVDYEDFIQTDAAINPGNSGGALIAMDGRLVGINTAILSRTGAYAGIGFAVPSSMARPIMAALLDGGEVQRGFLGVTIQEIDEDLAEAMDLESNRGVLVTDVGEGSPAARAGIRRGDIITQLGKGEIASVAQLRNTIAGMKPGTRIEITLQRDGKAQKLNVNLGRLELEGAASDQPSEESGPSFGIGLAPLDQAARQQLDVSPQTKGAVVAQVAPNSSAERAGLQPGDIIVEVNRKPVSSPAQVSSLLVDKTKSAVLLIQRDRRRLFVALKPPVEKDER